MKNNPEYPHIIISPLNNHWNKLATGDLKTNYPHAPGHIPCIAISPKNEIPPGTLGTHTMSTGDWNKLALGISHNSIPQQNL